MPIPAQEPKPDIQDEDIDALLEAFKENDAQNTHGDVEDLVAREAMDKPLESRAAEIHILLLKLVGKEAEEEVKYILDNLKTVTSTGEEMVDAVIELALDRGGMKKDMNPKALEAFMSDSELRAKAKEDLKLNLEAMMLDREVGNDEEKVSKLEKALAALER